VKAGDIYTRYQELTETYEIESLSDRRISDLPSKHLEMLDLIEAEYHYGGSKGKNTRNQAQPSAITTPSELNPNHLVWQNKIGRRPIM
jgi:Cdc6-like AAA superfamily ATPase